MALTVAKGTQREGWKTTLHCNPVRERVCLLWELHLPCIYVGNTC
jgi:hypothetical protein